MKCNVVWFRRDLRLSDNEIVSVAAANGAPTIFMFSLDPWFFKQTDIGEHRARFLVESLLNLAANLKKLGAELILLEGDSETTVITLLETLRSRGYSPMLLKNRDRMGYKGVRRESSVDSYCAAQGIQVHTGLAYFLLQDSAQSSNWIEPYYRYQEQPQWKIPNSFTRDELLMEVAKSLPNIPSDTLFAWVESHMGPITRAGLFVGGEIEAQRQLTSFLRSRYKGYHWKLSRPYLAQHGATSQLSPHIAFGTISTRQINASAYAMKQRLKTDAPNEVKTMASFLSRLRWRDSFTQRYALHPEIKWQNAYPEFDEQYNDKPLEPLYAERFEHWKNGTTGFPLLDASMRALNENGWMNFRMRAQAATMLTIIFGVSWHHGAEYFMKKLVDGDVAINHWQWQMQAGVTNPLSETFRIYNPTTNLAQRDPTLQYVHEWLPEYSNCKTVEDVLSQARPIVDWKYERRTRGAYISNIRRQVRERLYKQQGDEFNQAELMLRTTTRINKEYKDSAMNKNKRRSQKPAQLSLFEHADQ